MRKWIVLLGLAILLLGTAGSVAASPPRTFARFMPIDNSGVTGVVVLQQLSQGGTALAVDVHGLTPGTQYISLYYDNSDCTLPGDVFTIYHPNARGIAHSTGFADDDLSEIYSVSVRSPDEQTIYACATVQQ
jgi:hypothetical protein